jgi:hypothetical protein
MQDPIASSGASKLFLYRRHLAVSAFVPNNSENSKRTAKYLAVLWPAEASGAQDLCKGWNVAGSYSP